MRTCGPLGDVQFWIFNIKTICVNKFPLPVSPTKTRGCFLRYGNVPALQFVVSTASLHISKRRFVGVRLCLSRQRAHHVDTRRQRGCGSQA